ncbi:MAG TPA: hypothetical protein VGH95_01155 [Candidatus Aquirickettsiella sp.]|jgi:hypothetical protein
MQTIKNSAKQPVSFYSEILLDTTRLKKCDKALIEKALQLIKNLAAVDPEKAKMINNALKDYANSFNKTIFQRTMDIIKLLFLSLLGALVVSMAIMCLSLALLFFIPLLAFAPIQGLACIGIAIAGLALLNIGLFTLKTAMTLAEKIIDPKRALKEITAELNPYYEEVKKEFDLKQDKKVVLEESNAIENKPQPISSIFFRSSPHRDDASNEEDKHATHLNNMILATQLRK